MKLTIDLEIAKNLAENPSEILAHPLVSNPEHYIGFQWPTLLECIGCGSLYGSLPKFNAEHPLFIATAATLAATDEREVLFYIYDRLFTENLNQIRALPQINAPFLRQSIAEFRKKSPYLESTLAVYEAAFVEDSPNTMHDLILYLAWDRMCIWMGSLFNFPSTDPKFISGIQVLKECLIESYQHISKEGRTSPGIYRMIEALFYHQMREENMQKHSLERWDLLTKCFPVLKNEATFADCFYIDDRDDSGAYLTLDPPGVVGLRLDLAKHFVSELKNEVPNWEFAIKEKQIVSIR